MGGWEQRDWSPCTLLIYKKNRLRISQLVTKVTVQLLRQITLPFPNCLNIQLIINVPKNSTYDIFYKGAWSYIQPRAETAIIGGRELTYCGRSLTSGSVSEEQRKKEYVGIFDRAMHPPLDWYTKYGL